MAPGQKKIGAWTDEEDNILCQRVEQLGVKSWTRVAAAVPGRSAKSCRLRWCNQLSPDVVKKPFTPFEQAIVIRAQEVRLNKWSAHARLLPGRTDNSIKNHWNSTLRRVLRSTTEPYANKWLDQGVTLEWLVEHRDAYVPLEEAEAAKQPKSEPTGKRSRKRKRASAAAPPPAGAAAAPAQPAVAALAASAAPSPECSHDGRSCSPCSHRAPPRLLIPAPREAISSDSCHSGGTAAAATQAAPPPPPQQQQQPLAQQHQHLKEEHFYDSYDEHLQRPMSMRRLGSSLSSASLVTLGECAGVAAPPGGHSPQAGCSSGSGLTLLSSPHVKAECTSPRVHALAQQEGVYSFAVRDAAYGRQPSPHALPSPGAGRTGQWIPGLPTVHAAAAPPVQWSPAAPHTHALHYGYGPQSAAAAMRASSPFLAPVGSTSGLRMPPDAASHAPASDSGMLLPGAYPSCLAEAAAACRMGSAPPELEGGAWGAGWDGSVEPAGWRCLQDAAAALIVERAAMWRGQSPGAASRAPLLGAPRTESAWLHPAGALVGEAAAAHMHAMNSGRAAAAAAAAYDEERYLYEAGLVGRALPEARGAPYAGALAPTASAARACGEDEDGLTAAEVDVLLMDFM